MPWVCHRFWVPEARQATDVVPRSVSASASPSRPVPGGHCSCPVPTSRPDVPGDRSGDAAPPWCPHHGAIPGETELGSAPSEALGKAQASPRGFLCFSLSLPAWRRVIPSLPKNSTLKMPVGLGVCIPESCPHLAALDASGKASAPGTQWADAEGGGTPGAEWSRGDAGCWCWELMRDHATGTSPSVHQVRLHKPYFCAWRRSQWELGDTLNQAGRISGAWLCFLRLTRTF